MMRRASQNVIAGNLVAICRRSCSSTPELTSEHFRYSHQKHPLSGKQQTREWANPTQNHVWEGTELQAAIEQEAKVAKHFKPKGIMDRVINGVVRGCYHTFNFLTGFSKDDPSAKSLIYRVLILESIAGCPGMVAAGVRHFRSLRKMERDGGWIHTLLEEAENERMHLLVFMRMFKPGLITRATVVMLQAVVVSCLFTVYCVNPSWIHRFVGYLEETAVQTYLTIIDRLQDPTKQLHREWKDLKAPEIAINYWRLPADATFLDVIKQICADEMHHRDVNHTLASMHQKDFNPFVERHIHDQVAAVHAQEAKK
eukprot:TRINITY_DN1072_c1_g1_i1.p1 TRINITY_DN1072_c1_g1~~TRINITY_DN1072_c1_g1_i1.p1  ORF type:complete len:312 (+),score=50.59 TRINITY_DN1072_c1_g1_i1:88-1023(+)